MNTAEEVRNLTAFGQGALGKAQRDEPVFVLRAQDVLAPIVVRLWADMLTLAASGLAHDSEASLRKALGARFIADAMERWQKEKGSILPD